MANQHLKIAFTTIAIDSETNKLVEKICKRYSLKKGEVVKLAFQYLDNASINPSDAPESTKAELRKINKRQDHLIRFIRHYEEEQLNPMIRVANSIATKFDTTTKEQRESLSENIQDNRNMLAKLSEVIGNSFKSQNDVLNNHTNAINSLSKTFKQGNKKIEQIIYLYIELSNCGVMNN